MHRQFYLSDMRFIFYVFSTHLSLSRTATELRIHPSTVSRAIEDCERLLGVSLVRKSGKIFTLTDFGRIFADKIKSVVEDLKAFEDALPTLPVPTKEIKIGVHGSLMSSWVRACVLDLIETRPDMRFTFQDQFDIRDAEISPGRLYVGFGREIIQSDHIALRHVADIEIALFCSEGGPVDPEHIYTLDEAMKLGCALPAVNRRILVETENGEIHDLVHFAPYCRVESPSHADLIQAALRAKCVFVSSPMVVAQELIDGALFKVPLASGLKAASIDIFFHEKDKKDADVRQVIDTLFRDGRARYRASGFPDAR